MTLRSATAFGTRWHERRDRRLRSRVVAAVLATGVAVAASACGSDEAPDSEVVRLDASTRTATVEVGDEVEVTIGAVNSSVGDDWELTNVAPAGALTLEQERYEGGDCDSGASGCSDGTLIWTFARGAGRHRDLRRRQLLPRRVPGRRHCRAGIGAAELHADRDSVNGPAGAADRLTCSLRHCG